MMAGGQSDCWRGLLGGKLDQDRARQTGVGMMMLQKKKK